MKFGLGLRGRMSPPDIDLKHLDLGSGCQYPGTVQGRKNADY